MEPSGPIPTPPYTPGTGDRKGAAADLERWSCAIIDAINERDFDFQSPAAQEVSTHIATDWRGEIDTRGQRENKKPVTWAEQVAAWKERAEQYPAVHFAVQHVSSEVNERSGVGKVYMEMEVTGIGDVRLQAMNELRWRRTNGNWQLIYTLGFSSRIAMKFQYTHLERNSIRLIRFSQYATSAFIHVWIEHLPDFFKEKAHYTAISYHQDEGRRDEQRSITLNGRSFVVPPTLWDALSAIVEHHNQDDAYWVDAVSVNPGDPAEKSEQSLLMPRIFACADRILLWLGRDDELTEKAFNILRERARSCPYSTLDQCNEGDEHRVHPIEGETAAVDSLLKRGCFENGTTTLGILQSQKAMLVCGRFICDATLLVHHQRTSVGGISTESKQDSIDSVL